MIGWRTRPSNTRVLDVAVDPVYRGDYDPAEPRPSRPAYRHGEHRAPRQRRPGVVLRCAAWACETGLIALGATLMYLAFKYRSDPVEPPSVVFAALAGVGVCAVLSAFTVGVAVTLVWPRRDSPHGSRTEASEGRSPS